VPVRRAKNLPILFWEGVFLGSGARGVEGERDGLRLFRGLALQRQGTKGFRKSIYFIFDLPGARGRYFCGDSPQKLGSMPPRRPWEKGNCPIIVVSPDERQLRVPTNDN